MPLHLRKRKGSPNWYIYGTVKVGKETRNLEERSTGLNRKRDAEEYLARETQRIQDELIHGPSGRAKHITFEMIAESYIMRPGGLSKGDLWRISHMAPFMEDTPVSDVPKGWNRFRAKRPDMSPGYAARFRSTLVALLKYGCVEHDVPAPTIPAIKVNNKRVRWLTEEERERLLAAYTDHVRPIALTLCFQGCRTGEALRLTWRDVDFNRETLFFAETKNGDSRTVLMHDRVREALHGLWVERHRPIHGAVFLTRFGKPYVDVRTYKIPGGNPIKKAHATACRRAGIEDFTPHDWRHHFASWAVMKGVDLPTIQKLGGWKTISMVMRYAAVGTEHMDQAMRRMK